MMAEQMTKPSMDDLPRCSSTPPPAAKTWEGGGGKGTGYSAQFISRFLTNIRFQTNERNIVGQQLPTSLDVTCCVRLHTLLHVVAQSLKSVKLLGTCKRTQQRPQVANI